MVEMAAPLLVFVPNMISEVSEDLPKIEAYINTLEVEMKKINDLSLEIPCSLLIFNGAIETLKNQAKKMEWLEDTQLWPDHFRSKVGENGMGGLYKPRANRGGIYVSFDKSWELSKAFSTSTLRNQIGKGSSSFGIFVKRSEPKRRNEASLSKKKRRRYWSQELHRLFIDAIEQLGGAQVATPKQIKEAMCVEGLTNAQVKSHLQKYRIHIR